MSSGRVTKAKQGQRMAEALEAITRFEAAQQDWGFTELANELQCSSSQARNLVATLTLRGHLEPRETLVKKTLPMITAAGRAETSAQAA